MNEEAEQAAIAVVHKFIETFNAQDHERHADTLNYPHIRLAGPLRDLEFWDPRRTSREP
jgi:hypothetical protein